ncbi:unnamed protein product [Caenorhabditis angaria]|uniref:Zinc finger PHD-type domain-containing protein n=1 Tax=Caenorhabditis angaria TaxID=860376 RepID=A0A9P1IXM1_9PELO|nr:unnamed protein product [Caenorhabditis angaria]
MQSTSSFEEPDSDEDHSRSAKRRKKIDFGTYVEGLSFQEMKAEVLRMNKENMTLRMQNVQLRRDIKEARKDSLQVLEAQPKPHLTEDSVERLEKICASLRKRNQEYEDRLKREIEEHSIREELLKKLLDQKDLEIDELQKLKQYIGKNQKLRKLNEQHRKQSVYLVKKRKEEIKVDPSKKRKVRSKNYHNTKGFQAKLNIVAEGIEILTGMAGVKGYRNFLLSLMKQSGKIPALNFTPKFSVAQAISVQTTLGMPKNMLVRLKSYFRRILGVDPFPSTAAMDELAKTYMKEEWMDVRCEKNGEDEIEITELRKLAEVLAQKLTDLSKAKKLIFDRGKTTKLVAVIGNVRDANSCHNVIHLGSFTGDDTAENIIKYLPSIIKEINNLKLIQYEEDGVMKTREVEQFLAGDYKFLCSMHGHRGANAKEFCIFCYEQYSKKTKLQKYKRLNTWKSRTLSKYDEDQKSGKNSIKINSQRVFKLVTLDRVIPPSLHIIMGLSHKYIFDVLLNWALKCDLQKQINCKTTSQAKSALRKLQKDLSSKKRIIDDWSNDAETLKKMDSAMKNIIDKSISPSGDKAMGNKKKAMSLKCHDCNKLFHEHCIGVWTPELRIDHEDPDEYLCCFACRKVSKEQFRATIQSQLQVIEDYTTGLKKKLEALEKEEKELNDNLNTQVGKHRQQLENVWKKYGADRSTWTQTFSGNQTYRLLKKEAIDEMFDIFLNNPKVDQNSLEYLRVAATSLGVIQRLCTTETYDQHDLARLQESKEEFFKNVTLGSPDETLTVKLHLLLNHVVPFANQHSVWGRLSEQSVESYHAYYNKLLRRFESVRDPIIRLRRIFRFIMIHSKVKDSNELEELLDD